MPAGGTGFREPSNSSRHSRNGTYTCMRVQSALWMSTRMHASTCRRSSRQH